MSKSLRLALAGALTLGIVAGTPGPVSANQAGDSTIGGCDFNTDRQPTVTGDRYVGVIFDKSVTTDPKHLPTGATVECWVTINGVKVDSTDLVATGFGVQANSKQISYTAADWDNVQLCQTVTYADGTIEPPCDEPCNGADECPFPPQQLLDLFTTVNNAVSAVLCPVTKTVYGIVGPDPTGTGLVTLDSLGDVTVPDPLNLGFNPLIGPCPGALPV